MKRDSSTTLRILGVLLALALSALEPVGGSTACAGDNDGIGGYKFKVDDQGGGGIQSDPGYGGSDDPDPKVGEKRLRQPETQMTRNTLGPHIIWTMLLKWTVRWW